MEYLFVLVRRLVLGSAVGVALWGQVALGLGPHEIALIVNGRVPASVRVADHYTRLRGVPPSHVVTVDVPWDEAHWGISAAEFETGIFRPVSEEIRARGIDDQILAWVYSVGFPTRIKGPQAVSLHGMTFLRGQLPPAAEIANATYQSALFAGGGHENRTLAMTQSLDAYARWLGSDMPLPSMSLGIAGERGSSEASVLESLSRGAACDGTRPKGPVYFIDGNDVRIRCRSWQFQPAVRALRRAGIDAAVVSRPPEGGPPLLGLFTGVAETDPGGYRFLPGAIADNLTSFAGAFDVAAQTKLTAWLDAGAVAAVGAVVEPMSHYRKFPLAQIYVHYATGCTVLEAYYQSIASPLQQLIVGDPLAAPFARQTELALEGMPQDGVLRGSTTIQVKVSRPMHYNRRRFTFLLDGRVVGEGEEWVLKPDGLTPGGHTLRAVAFTYGAMRSQCFAESTFDVLGGVAD